MLKKSRALGFAAVLLLPVLGGCESTSGANTTAAAPHAGEKVDASRHSDRLWPDINWGGE